MRSYVDYHLEREMLNQYFATFEDRMLVAFQGMSNEHVARMQEESFDADALREEVREHKERIAVLDDIKTELKHAQRVTTAKYNNKRKDKNSSPRAANVVREQRETKYSAADPSIGM